jgi:hypothetical protein
MWGAQTVDVSEGCSVPIILHDQNLPPPVLSPHERSTHSSNHHRGVPLAPKQPSMFVGTLIRMYR